MSTTSKVLMGFVLGAMMSIDFGGPLNKAAYVFRYCFFGLQLTAAL